MRIAVLAGGVSPEREVSLRSGKAVAGALKQRGHTVVLLDPARRDFPRRILTMAPACAFIALHGGIGENGVIQGFLETLGIPFTGSPTCSSAVCMNKLASKKILLFHHIPTPRFAVIARTFKEKKPPFPTPFVVKPASLGSTIGIAVVHNRDDFEPALREAFRYDREVFIEQFIKGPEVTAAVLGNEDPVVLPVIQIKAPDGFYDYRAKYVPGGSEHVIPPHLPRAVIRHIERIARAAHTALGCRGLSRMEMIVDWRGIPQVLDINTIPGFTATSLFPDAARAAGIPFVELCEQLVNLALERWKTEHGIG